MPTVVFPPDQLAEAAALYRAGHSLYDLMEKYGVSQRQLQKNLDSVGVEYRDGNRKYVTNEHVFDDLSSEEAAYWAGFLYADGTVTGTVLAVRLSAKDKVHLEKLRDFVGPGRPVHDRVYNGYDIVGLQVCGVHFARRLNELGVVLYRDSLPEAIRSLTGYSARHWIRGLFDGDGSATKAGRILFCGNSEALGFVRSTVYEIVGLDSEPYKHQSAEVYYLPYNRGYPAKEVAEYLYDGATVYLQRKQDVILNVWPETCKASVPELSG